ncbi:NlpC/P60 family protein [Streptacidiphilus sp. EB129]|uniref:NlpC/P60 family protein n=1 Tax=Streptacidiphilus sp. EB129 TaxID=3156262 RepID=UPI003511E5D0
MPKHALPSATRRTVANRLFAGMSLAGVGLGLPLVTAASASAAPVKAPAAATTSTDSAPAATRPAAAHSAAHRAARTATATSATYTVVSGDWLSSIAAKRHVSGGWERLYQLNRGTLTHGADVIYPGQKLALGGALAATGSSGSGASSDSEGEASSAATTSSSPSSSSSSFSSSSDAAGAASSAYAAATQATAATTQTAVQAPGGSTSSGIAAAVAFAKSQVGDAYVYGGTSSAGWDCSGLAQASLAQAGISIPRVAADQAAASTHVSLDALQPGDLLFWSNDGTDAGVYHVAIYIGGGQYVEAANPSSGVKYETIANWAPDFAGRIG